MRSSLSVHLRQSDEHGALPFHAGCPICRDERLAGTLPAARLLPPRGSAALAAGVLALSVAAPPVTLAQGPDQPREGTIEPDAPVEDSAHSPDFDPGGPSAVLPDELEPASPEAPALDVSELDGPLEQESDTDFEPPVDTQGEEGGVPGVGPSAPAVQPPPAATEGTPPAELPGAPPAEQPEAVSSPIAGEDENASRTDRLRKKTDRHTGRSGRDRAEDAGEATVLSESAAAEPAAPTGGEPVAPIAEAAPSAPGTVEAPATSGTPTRVEPSDRIDSRDRTYVVREGDSLWSVAADRLGGDASVAEIAREVNRLWELNRERIATGDPDLVLVGTRLMLR
jgi:hypothetical protein